MDLLKQLKAFSNASEYAETNNFFYTYHNCTTTGDNTKVMLDYKIATELSDAILKLGICPHCGICFYHRDYDSKTF